VVFAARTGDLLPSQCPVKRRPPDLERPGHGGGAFALLHQRARVGDLRRGQGGLAADARATGAGGVHTRPRPFLYQRALELGKRPHHVKDEAAPGRRRVDAFRQGAEASALRADLAD
jgi:hypothetical protein